MNRNRLYFNLVIIVVTNVIVWLIWAYGDRDGGAVPWPVWVFLGTMIWLAQMIFLGKERPPRERNRNRDRGQSPDDGE